MAFHMIPLFHFIHHNGDFLLTASFCFVLRFREIFSEQFLSLACSSPVFMIYFKYFNLQLNCKELIFYFNKKNKFCENKINNDLWAILLDCYATLKYQ